MDWLSNAEHLARVQFGFIALFHILWPPLTVGLCALPGLLLYVLNAWTLWQDPATRLRGFTSLWSVVWPCLSFTILCVWP